MRIGTHTKQPREVRRLIVNYENFLVDDEVIVAVIVRYDTTKEGDDPPTSPDSGWGYAAFSVIAAIGSAAVTVDVTVTGGRDNSAHVVTVLATTSLGQKKEDEILVNIKENT